MPVFTPTLALAAELAKSQNYPSGTLYMVASPIGNRADIGVRALHVLGLVDAVACEDTRHTQQLLQGYGIEKPLLSVHAHNELAMVSQVVSRLESGERLAYLSDAGTPGISDPGQALVAAVRERGFRVVPVPGASSVSTLLSAAGLGGGDSSFVFLGFVPPKAGERQSFIESLEAEKRAVVFFETPHRVDNLAKHLSLSEGLAARSLTVGRELTKQFEEIATLTAQALCPWLAQSSGRTKGEFAFVLHPEAAHKGPLHAPVPPEVLKTLLEALPLKTVVEVVCGLTKLPRKAVYAQALAASA